MTPYQSAHFTIIPKHLDRLILLTQQIIHPAVHTIDLPATLSVLSHYIPTIFDNECKNVLNIPFKNEAIATQVGHLFEHLFIENLKLKAVELWKTADFIGETQWDWTRETYGRFNITVYTEPKYSRIIDEAYMKSISILETIYAVSNTALN